MASRKKVGSSWRVLAHSIRGNHPSFDVGSADSECGGREKRPHSEIFDELVIDGWFHLEQMEPRVWWLCIGKDMVMISIDRHGKPKLGEWYE